MSFKVAKVHENARVPVRGSKGAAGYDLSSVEQCTIQPGDFKMVDTGIAVQFPSSYYARVAPRSGLAAKFGIDVFAGVVDSDYTGSIRVILMNNSKLPFVVNEGDRVAQLIFTRIETPELEEVMYNQLCATDRGADGFGSTGVA